MNASRREAMDQSGSWKWIQSCSKSWGQFFYLQWKGWEISLLVISLDDIDAIMKPVAWLWSIASGKQGQSIKKIFQRFFQCQAETLCISLFKFGGLSWCSMEQKSWSNHTNESLPARFIGCRETWCHCRAAESHTRPAREQSALLSLSISRQTFTPRAMAVFFFFCNQHGAGLADRPEVLPPPVR